MIKIKEIPKDMIPGGFVSSLPEVCVVCGIDLEITEPLTEVVCKNKNCDEKINYRLKSMVTKLGLKELIQEEDIKEFIDSRGIDSPYAILAYNSERDGEFISGFGEEKSKQVTKSINKKRGMLLWEYIELGAIKGLRGNTEKIVGDCKSIQELYKQILEGGVKYIQEKLVTDTEGVYVNAVVVYNALITHQKELEKYIRAVVLQDKENSRGMFFAVDNVGMTREDIRDFIMEETGRRYYLYETKDIESSDYIFIGETNTVKEISILQELKGRETCMVGEIIEDINGGE